MDDVIVFESSKQLKEDLERMRTELSILILKRDDLNLQVGRNLEMKYLLIFGALEYEEYEAECSMRRAKRKLELATMCRNRGKKIDIKAIEERLDIEFHQYSVEKETIMAQINQAIDRNNGEFLSKKDTENMKKLYRKAVKKLHPDLNPNMSTEKRKLFDNLVSAYEAGDLQTVEMIAELVQAETLTEGQIAEMTTVKEKERLQKMIIKIQKEIDKIEHNYPFTLKKFIENDETINKNKEKIQASINRLKAMEKKYVQEFQSLVKEGK